MSIFRRFSFVTLVSGAVLVLLAPPANAAGLEVGTCKRDITPISSSLAAAYQAAFGVPAVVNHTDPVFMAGFGNGRDAPATTTACGRAASCSTARAGASRSSRSTRRLLQERDRDDARDDLAELGDRLRGRHEHASARGARTRSASGARTRLTTGIDFGYLDFVNAAIADCIDEAAAHLQQARV